MSIINWRKFFTPYEQVVDELVVKLNGISKNFINENKNSPIISVSGRVKSIDSILLKCKRKNINYNEDEIKSNMDDIAGIRLICRFVEDINIVVESIKSRENFDIKVIREKNFISNIKESGYRSYHLIVEYPLIISRRLEKIRAEIQVRTMAMDFWSTIEHSLKYKYKSNIPEDVKKRLVASAEASFKLDMEMSKIRGEILESVEISKVKTNLVDEILKNIEKLYFSEKVEVANEFNKNFFEIYEEDNLDKLVSFNNQLKTATIIYKN